AVRAHAERIAGPVARDRAQGDRPAGRPGPGGAQARLGQLHRAQAGAALDAPDELLGGAAAARLPALFALAQAGADVRVARRTADAGPVDRRARGPARAPAPGRRRGDGLRGERAAGAGAARSDERRRLALCPSRTQWQRARASLAAPARAERGRRPGPAPEHPHWAGRAAHQPRRLPRKRTAGGIDPILLPQRVLRLRRRDATRREMTHSIQGAILTPFGWRLGELHHDGGRVVAI